MPNSFTGYLTGGLLDPVAPDFAGAAARNERQRQGLIGYGLDAINAVYSGGTTPTWNWVDPSASKFDPKGQYYLLSNQGKFNPYAGQANPNKSPGFSLWSAGTNPLGFGFMGTGSGALASIPFGLGALFGGDNTESPLSRLKKRFNKGMLFTEQDKTFKGFQPDFFNKAAQSYVDFATPQLAKQYDDTQRSITYGLSNRGLLSSGARNKAMSDLALTTGQAEQGIADTARGTAQGLLKNITAARQAAIDALYQSADPGRALQQAVSSAAQFSIPSSFAPLANSFSSLANQYATNYLYNPPVQAGYAANPWQFFGQGQAPNAGALPQVALY
jgi:hypothetical protein